MQERISNEQTIWLLEQKMLYEKNRADKAEANVDYLSMMTGVPLPNIEEAQDER